MTKRTKTPAKRFFASLALNEKNERGGGESPTPVSSVQLLRKGAFQHAWHGLLEIDEPLFGSLIRNFDADARGIDIALDVEHMPDQGAAGWFRRLFTENSENELWGDVEWTPAGRKLVEEGAFKYLSIEYDLEYADEEGGEHGPTMLGAALTNRPFIKRMRAASFRFAEPRNDPGMILLTEQERRLHSELARLDAEKARLEEELRKASVERVLSEGKRKGRVSPAMESWLEELAEKEGVERLRAVLETLPQQIDFSEIGSPGGAQSTSAADALHEAVNAEMRRMREENPDAAPSYADALAAVESRQPSLVEAYKAQLR